VRQRIASLVLLALLVRALVPAGFMLAPAQGDPSGLSVVICSAQGPQAIVLDEDGNQSQPKASHDVCPFAASVLPGFVSEPTEVVAQVEFASVAYRLARLQFSATPRPSAASARGPPRLV
jgi:hypothetical protein